MKPLLLRTLGYISILFCLSSWAPAQIIDPENASAAKWLRDKKLTTELNELYNKYPTDGNKLPLIKLDRNQVPSIQYNNRNYHFRIEELRRPSLPKGYLDSLPRHERLREDNGWGNSSGGDGVACFNTHEAKLAAQKSLKSHHYLSQEDKEQIKEVHLYELWELHNPEWIFQDVYLMALVVSDPRAAQVLDPYDQLFTLIRSFAHSSRLEKIKDLTESLLGQGFPADFLSERLVDSLARPQDFQETLNITSNLDLPEKTAGELTQLMREYRSATENKLKSYGQLKPHGLDKAADAVTVAEAIHSFLETRVPALELRLQLYEQSYPRLETWRPARLTDVKDSCDSPAGNSMLNTETKRSCEYHNKLLEEHPTCLKIQLVNRITNSRRDGSLPFLSFHYDRWIVDNKMSPLNQEFLKHHEYLYALGTEIGHVDSDHIRRVVRTHSHPFFPDLLNNFQSLTSGHVTTSVLFNRILGDYVIHSEKALAELAKKAPPEALAPRLFLASVSMFQKIREAVARCSYADPEIEKIGRSYGVEQADSIFCQFYFHEFMDKTGFFTDEEAFVYSVHFILKSFRRVYNPENVMIFDLKNPGALPKLTFLEINKTCDFLKNGPRLEKRRPEFTGAFYPMLDQALRFCESLPFEPKNPLFLVRPELEGKIELKDYYKISQ